MKKTKTNYSFLRFGYTLIFLLTILVVDSCNDKETVNLCPEEYFGEFELLEDSRSKIPYYQNSMIFFSDSIGTEVSFKFSPEDKGFEQQIMTQQIPCKNDNTKIQKNNADVETYKYYINEITKLTGVTFFLTLGVEPFENGKLMVSDKIRIAAIPKSDNSDYYSFLSILVNPRELTQEEINKYPEPIEELKLLNKTFYNVYTEKDSSVYYNFDVGFVAFRDTENKLWVHDRTEELK